jgi:hypothetical protein
MSNVPEGAQRSDDGRWWWDGSEWQPVPDDNANTNANDNSNADVTPEELQPVNDTGVDPGDDTKLDDRLRPYFEPDVDNAPDDTSNAEQAETLDDSQATGPQQAEQPQEGN